MAIRKTTTKKSTPAKKSSSVGNKADMRKYEVESAMSTLQRAADIQKNAKMMSDIKKLASEKAQEYNNIASGKKF